MRNKAIAGFALSVVGLVLGFAFGWVWICALLSLPAAITGLVLSVMAGKEYKAADEKWALQSAGFVIGIIAIIFASISFLTCGICGIIGTIAGVSLNSWLF